MSFKNTLYRMSAIGAALTVLLASSGCSEKDAGKSDNSASSPSYSQQSVSSTAGSEENLSSSKSSASSKSELSSGGSTSAPSKSNQTTTKSSTTTKKSTYAYAYAGFNPAPADMSVPYTELLLNKNYILPDGYVPKLAEAVKGSGVKLDYRVAPHYQEMYDAAKKDGITLTPVSGYRSFQRQKNNFENSIAQYQKQGYSKKDATIKASETRLLPGTSEHNAGLAMDICSLSTSFDTTKEYKWLQAHAHEYGFILRYPKDKINITQITYEPWHYRYVGTEIAKKLKESGQVLEEYLGKA